MATLVKCVECSGVISSQAARCPRCSTRYPLGVKCVVCCQILKRSEALKISKDYGEIGLPTSVRFFHYSCHQKVSQLRTSRSRTSCPVCQHAIEFDTSSSVLCPNCGQKFPTHLKNPSFAPCYYCGFSLNKSLEVAIRESQRRFLDGWIAATVYAHRICYTKERQAAEEKQQKDEQLEKARAYQENTSHRRRKKTGKYRENLAISIILGLTLGIIVGGLGGGLSHFVFGFGGSWESAALLGFCSVSILTVVAVLIVSFFE